ncbi:hypothetical protein [Demequina flava]|uniref:hypothetical protein n=1 Tax=Demequina flava TaxID=1095025 RepID=UPI0007805FA2|nr:hypothetical protein [Demequina flava]
MTNEITPLELPGSVGSTEIKGAQGVLYFIRHDDEIVSRRRGRWLIPMANGEMGELRAHGWVPGFQRLSWQGTEIFRMGAHATLAEKIAMFAPLLLVLLGSFLAVVLGLVLFFMSVRVVKTPAMPIFLRIALPIINTVAGGLIVILLAGLLASG